MLSCKVSVMNKNCEQCTIILTAPTRREMYQEIAEMCAAFDDETKAQICAIKVDTIISDNN